MKRFTIFYSPSVLLRPGFLRFLGALLFFGFSLFLSAPPARPEWSWPEKSATASVTPDYIDTSFTFRNNGSRPVRVTELKFSCSCADFTFESTTAAPGKDGRLQVRLPRKSVRKGATIEIVAFGPEGTSATVLTVAIPD